MICLLSRLWGDHGQKKLENAKVCLINATALGTEILKNLVLPGKWCLVVFFMFAVHCSPRHTSCNKSVYILQQT